MVAKVENLSTKASGLIFIMKLNIGIESWHSNLAVLLESPEVIFKLLILMPRPWPWNFQFSYIIFTTV